MSQALIDAVMGLVKQAGEAILPYWRQPLEVQEKLDQSPVTAADLAAHEVLLQGLQALVPEIPVLSEEDAQLDLAERQQWSRWWLVDPLDGTKEFIAGSEEFTVNVALIEHGRVLWGVVGIPATGAVYFGGAGLGAYCQHNGMQQHLEVRSTALAQLTVVASRRHSSAEQEALLAGLQQQFSTLELVSVGSSLKFCLLAEGKADFYPRLAPTSQWDTAAAQAVLEGAGGQVVDLAGQPLSYPARESYLNPFFMALPAQAPWRETVLALSRSLA